MPSSDATGSVQTILTLDMQAVHAYYAGTMKKGIQYTIRNVPERVDGALRKLAVREGASLNSVAREALEAGAGVKEEPVKHHDLDALAGTWVQDDAFDKGVEAFEVVDEDLWR